MGKMAEWWTGVEAALKQYEVVDVEVAPSQRSSVAAILDFRPEPHVLLMQRVEHERDPWSGHVSLPGGRSSSADRDLLATAIRETREEVDVDLATHARLLGHLAPRRAVSRGQPQDLDVTPFIFLLERAVNPTPMEEAEALFWLPLEQACSGAFNHEYQFKRNDQLHRTAAWKFGDFIVWGMTYRILENLLAICRAK